MISAIVVFSYKNSSVAEPLAYPFTQREGKAAYLIIN